MPCESCGSDLIVLIDAKCNDLCCVQYGGLEHDSYLPRGFQIGDMDYISLKICYSCGKLQGIIPMTDEEIREIIS